MTYFLQQFFSILKHVVILLTLRVLNILLVYVFLRNVLEKDEGFYHCEVENDKDLVISNPAYLLPAGLGKIRSL